jgi:hypothetical protein
MQCNLNAELLRMNVLERRNHRYDYRSLGLLRPILDHQEAINKRWYWKFSETSRVD